MTSWPVSVTTISSSIRAALQPSFEGQNVSSANTIPGLISSGCSNETRRLITGFSQMANPMPCPYCKANAASSFGNPKSCALGQTESISEVVLADQPNSFVLSDARLHRPIQLVISRIDHHRGSVEQRDLVLCFYHAHFGHQRLPVDNLEPLFLEGEQDGKFHNVHAHRLIV